MCEPADGEAHVRGQRAVDPVEGHRQVQPAVREQPPEREVVLHPHLELDARVRPGEAGEGFGKPALGDVLRHSEPEVGLGLLAPEALQQLVVEREYSPSRGEDPLALGVQLEATAGLVEQRPSALRLQALQLEADRGERAPHPSRRARERAGLLNQGKGSQQLEIQGLHGWVGDG